MDGAVRDGGILVLGVGNVLLGDEGAGVHIARELARRPLPPGVDVVDGGTIGFGLATLLPGRRAVILVDAIDPPEPETPPGSVFRFSPGEVPLRRHDRRSAHGEDISLLLFHARGLSPPPEIVIFGIVPEDAGADRMGPGPALLSRMDDILGVILREIERIHSLPG
jgi:hydrogenase maturation protease